ncbi:hypothetical protein O203_17710 [Ectopseudomonas chengduensis]|nr:hypothetical protein O203_17710 [Pseudomonas chengduensis]
MCGVCRYVLHHARARYMTPWFRAFVRLIWVLTLTGMALCGGCRRYFTVPLAFT